jgi:hypothetical protein
LGVFGSTDRAGNDWWFLVNDCRKCSTIGENWKMDALSPKNFDVTKKVDDESSRKYVCATGN